MELIGIVLIFIIVIAVVLVSLFMKSLLWSSIMFFISHYVRSFTGTQEAMPAVPIDDPEDTAQRREFTQMAEENHGEIYREKIIARIIKPLRSVEDKSVLWNILFTEKAVYFFKLSKSVSASTPLPWELNLFLRITMRSYIKQAENSIGFENLVSRCSNAIRFGSSDIDRIRLIGGADGQIEFENKGKIYRIAIPHREYRFFAETLKNSYTS